MAFFSFGGRVTPKKFEYIPRHYDPAKEELHARLGKYGDSKLSSEELAKSRIRSGFKMKGRGNPEFKKAATKQANIRLLIIVAILIMITVYFLQSDGLASFIKSME